MVWVEAKMTQFKAWEERRSVEYTITMKEISSYMSQLEQELFDKTELRIAEYSAKASEIALIEKNQEIEKLRDDIISLKAREKELVREIRRLEGLYRRAAEELSYWKHRYEQRVPSETITVNGHTYHLKGEWH
jgi:predicted  nucleic acid-binding Zn-ribbon protein